MDNRAKDGVRDEVVRDAVRSRYGEIAKVGPGSAASCCGTGSPGSCCNPAVPEVTIDKAATSRELGYTEDELSAVPQGANLGLGCGNPQAIAQLEAGETVLDLGAGGGFDCFLAARAVGPAGMVIGVDMTSEMVALARGNAREGGYENVYFRLGEIEHLPVADGTVDCIISNCVINLSPDKAQVFADSFRVLKPGGRLAVSDVVATAELPKEWRDDMDKLSACISGAATVTDLERMLRQAGFVDISISPKEESRAFIRKWEPGTHLQDYVLSASIRARKP